MDSRKRADLGLLGMLGVSFWISMEAAIRILDYVKAHPQSRLQALLTVMGTNDLPYRAAQDVLARDAFCLSFIPLLVIVFIVYSRIGGEIPPRNRNAYLAVKSFKYLFVALPMAVLIIGLFFFMYDFGVGLDESTL